MVRVQCACCVFEGCQSVKMCSWRSLISYIALGIFLGPMKQVSGQDQDGFLRCDDKWISGIDVTLRCEVNMTSIEDKCAREQNSTFFKKDDVNQCSVLDNEYANCLPEGGQPDPTSSCWCEKNDTFFIFMHKFKADRFKSEGLWTCQKACFDSGGFNNPLIMSADNSCNSSVEVSECETKPCNPPSSCELDRERNKARCVCPIEYHGEDCQKCGGFPSLPYGCDRIGIVAFIGVIIVALILLPYSFIWAFFSNKTWTLAPGQDTSLIAEQLRSEFIQFIDETDSICSKRVEIGVTDGFRDGVLLIKGKNICSLTKVYLKAKKIIKERANEPTADYPSGRPMPQPKYTGKGNGQQKKSKSDKEIPLSTVGRSSPPSETSGDEKTHMISAKTGRVLPVPTNQPELTSIGIRNSASQRLEPLKTDQSKMPSVERNSGAFSRDLPSPRQQPLEPIPSGKNG